MRQEQTAALHVPRRSHLEEERVHTEGEGDDGRYGVENGPSKVARQMASYHEASEN